MTRMSHDAILHVLMLLLVVSIVLHSCLVGFTRGTVVGAIGRHCVGTLSLVIGVAYVLRTIRTFRTFAAKPMLAGDPIFQLTAAKLIPILGLVLLLVAISVTFFMHDSDATFWLRVVLGIILTAIYTIVPLWIYGTCYDQYIPSRIVVPLYAGCLSLRTEVSPYAA